MSRILCIITGLDGILNASFELLKRLQAEGNECILASPKNVGAMVTSQGYDYIQLDPISFDPAPALPSFEGPLKKFKRLIYKYRHASQRKLEAIEALKMKSFAEQVKKINPDEIYVDIEMHEHIMTVYSKGYQVKLLSQWFSTWNRSGLPPIITDIIPGQGIRGSSFGIKSAWLKIKIHRWWIFFKKSLFSARTDRRSILIKYARDLGFPLQYIKENYWPGPFSYDQLPVVSMTLENLEFPHSKRRNMEYIGPMVFDERNELKCSQEVQSQIEELIKVKLAQDLKLIYCSVSTFKPGDINFIKKVIQSVRNELDWVLIIGLGEQLNPDFSNCPDNVFVYDYVPQLQVLQSADLSINHGGIHTINECLRYQVPMLVYSGKRSDQNGCAARVHFHGIGLMADKDMDSAKDINDKIKIILGDGSFKRKLEEITR